MDDVIPDKRTTPGRPYPEGLEPPVETLDLAKGLLSAHHAERGAQRLRERVAAARYQDRARDLVLGHLRAEAGELRQLEAQRRAQLAHRLDLCDRLGQRHHGRLERGADAGDGATAKDIVYGTGIALAAAPYDFDWVGGGPGIEHANRLTGDYDLRVQSIGAGGDRAAAGVGFWFYSGDGNPMQRFAALLDYSDIWWESAQFYVADNDAHTRLWVFGVSEKAWVAQSDQQPSWSDHVGWLDSHGNSPEGEEGRVVNETFFRAAPRSWYQCWIWSEAHVYADGGFWGFADSTIGLNVSVRFGVMGSL